MKYDLKKDLRSTIDGLAVSLSIIIILAFTGSLIARMGWLFDLTSHFVMQYAIGGYILTVALLFLRKRRLALIISIIAVASSAEIYQYHRHYYQAPTSAQTSDKTITVVQYNRFAAHFKHAVVIDWLRAQPFDIVVLQEANESLSIAVSSLKDIYPYQLHEPRSHAFGMIILSRYKFEEAQKINSGGTFFFRIKFEKYDSLPITLYALHAMVPIGTMRDIELQTTSQYIAEDPSDRIIFMGDWNITPFSPHFEDILRKTKLQHRDTNLYPSVTWLSTFMLPILQIPIDQILFSPTLTLTDKHTGPAMGSDHYPLIATFSLN